ncbi:hypothetical protein BUALT_Bualt01G0064200 [Buddleja alternifolia]|uniref:BAG domain-containing protein n=1 Tax=Buddleja alternifolia TaxID=168488 RepID=A0AAV6YFF4_9LAMI|nr:hypothetical protein BUALT_Bualt01G0064200 [Buddleja alternifolia]
MSRFRRYDIVERTPSYFHNETSIFTPPKSLLLNHVAFPSFPIVDGELDCALDLLEFSYNQPILFDEFDTFTDLIQIDEAPFPFHSSARRHRLGDLYLQTLCDRVSDLELGFDRMVREKTLMKKKVGERKCTWTAEIKGRVADRKYKWTGEIKDKKGGRESYKWTAGIKGKGNKYSPINQSYRIKACSDYSSSSSGSDSEKETDKKKKKKMKGEKAKDKGKSGGSNARIVEIHDPSDHGAMYLRQGYAKRMDKRKGKRKELSPQDAAALIQTTFRSHLFRRSHALHALRELAIARNKFKEIKALFNNYSYRRRLARDAEERQKFSEKIIVLLLTVDGIEGTDLMVRAARKLMVEELEAMLDVVDPQHHGKSLSMRRRTFDMPGGMINKELAAGVAQVVQMLDQEPTGAEPFEACL